MVNKTCMLYIVTLLTHVRTKAFDQLRKRLPGRSREAPEATPVAGPRHLRSLSYPRRRRRRPSVLKAVAGLSRPTLYFPPPPVWLASSCALWLLYMLGRIWLGTKPRCGVGAEVLCAVGTVDGADAQCR